VTAVNEKTECGVTAYENPEREVMIQVKDLYKIYKMGETKVHALDGVDFEIYRGEFCAITGPSGSGKSTLLNMLAGLEHPTKGEIIIAGKHIEKLNEKNFPPRYSNIINTITVLHFTCCIIYINCNFSFSWITQYCFKLISLSFVELT
jgi:ABC-type multidrug transport system ATPase subunit